MRILHLVPGLLQVVHDAEDERVALDAACAWVRTHAGARGVAVVAAGGGEVVAQAGWSERRVRNEVHSQVCRETPHTWSDEAGPGGPVQVTAPVRYAGAIIGHVLAAGSREEAEMVEDGVQALAALCGPALRARLDALAVPNDPSSLMPELIGRSAVMTAVCEQVRQAARTGFPVLIEGESGTGKELVARALHRLSDRRSRRLMAVNCAALTDDLVEAELFGFARGAFTGAVTARAGLFEDAHRGSLFLDEVSELSARAQAKLLRALQEREVRRVGENTARAVDVRVIAATNQPLAEAAASRRFREDLLFRLAVLRIALPPLRDRLEDLPALATALIADASRDLGRPAPLLDEAALAVLRVNPFRGNVRELRNMLERALVRCRGPVLGAAHLGLSVGGGQAPALHALKEMEPLAAQGRATALHTPTLGGGRALALQGDLPLDLGELERLAIAEALRRVRGNRTHAARLLGIGLRTLRNKLRTYREAGVNVEAAEAAAGQLWPSASGAADEIRQPCRGTQRARTSQETSEESS
jgi:DNA-binding NtrC family response regulator